MKNGETYRTRSYKFVKAETLNNLEAKKAVCRAVIFKQNALSDHQLGRIERGKLYK